MREGAAGGVDAEGDTVGHEGVVEGGDGWWVGLVDQRVVDCADGGAGVDASVVVYG